MIRYPNTGLWILFLTIVACSNLYATELAPWFGKEKDLRFRPSYTYRYYRSVDTHEGTVRHHSSDHLTHFSFEMTNEDTYGGELEYLLAYTSQRPYSSRALTMTGRYLLLDDVIGDPFSIMGGVTLRYVTNCGLHDISFFYHGHFEVEPTLAFGREIICREFWTSRWWGVVGAGIADRGSPWIKTDLNLEFNWWDEQQIRVFVNTLWGLGEHDLTKFTDLDHFRGYASINHQSIDAGFSYQYNYACWGDIRFEYYYRLYGRNCPLHVNSAMVRLTFPLGIPSFFRCCL